MFAHWLFYELKLRNYIYIYKIWEKEGTKYPFQIQQKYSSIRTQRRGGEDTESIYLADTKAIISKCPQLVSALVSNFPPGRNAALFLSFLMGLRGTRLKVTKATFPAGRL